MMMTINATNTFFWTTIQKNFYLLITKNKVLFLLGLFLFISCNKSENLILKSLKTPTGWGYYITNNGKIIIKQAIIPVISENKSFKTEREALKVGNLVLQKLKDDLSPTVTKKDLFLLAVKI
ncbi:DUF4907 domain-containing protein [Flavobacterium sp. LS2R12]|uniref:DUF4907 domain-containing protein n=1 Tax=unclassified Flavobacterium TaxID=196869 RepID=UPI003AB00722